VNESSEAFRVIEPAVLAQVGQHAEERFLEDVFTQLGRSDFAAQFDGQQFSEVFAEVLLDLGLAGYQGIQVSLVERLKCHGPGTGTIPKVYRPAAGAATSGSATGYRRFEW
jgi:hypothetical protein